MLVHALLLLPVPVTPYELGQHSERYNGRIVYTETVLDDISVDDRWRVLVEPKDTFEFIVSGEGKPDAKKGDKVAIIGHFRYTDISFVPRVIRGARMQRIPFDVTPEQLRGKRSPFNGRLVRVEGEVKYVDRWADGTDTFTLHPRTPEVLWGGKPGISKGDRVRVTGVFNDNRDTFETGRIDVRKSASEEKLGKP